MPVPSVGVPAIPQWFKEWGWVPIGFAVLVLSALIADVGRAHGKGAGWFLFILLVAACAAAWGLAYRRRLGKARAAFRLGLIALSCLAAVDAMTGRQFEFYYASLLRELGWTDVEVIGDRAGGDGGADILATDPRGRRFAIQCKRYTLPGKVSVADVRELNGSLAHEHQGRLGLIVTSSELTKPARALAGKSGIQVIERADLAAQMARITDETGQDKGLAA
jgi:restriction system protein